MADLPFNAILIAVDAAVVAAVLCRRRAAVAMAGLVAGGLAAAVLCALLGEGTFHLLRLYAYALFLHGPLLFAGVGAAMLRRSTVFGACCLLAAAAIAAAGIDAFLVEPRWLAVRHVALGSEKLTRPLRIVVVADLQTDHVGAYEERVWRTVLDARPDLILMPGDFLHEPDRGRYEALAGDLRRLLTRLGVDAPLGVYAVRGNVEHDDWPLLFRGLAVRPIVETATLEVGELTLTGLGLRDSFDTRLRVAGSARFHVVFGHAPDFGLGRVEADLLIAGHTHGGQVRLPLWGPLLTFSRLPRSWTAGVTRLDGGRTLVVSRGIGMERARAPRMRFLCRPEIVVIDVSPGAPSTGEPHAAGGDPERRL